MGQMVLFGKRTHFRVKWNKDAKSVTAGRIVSRFGMRLESAFYSDVTEPKSASASVYLILTDRREICEIKTEVG